MCILSQHFLQITTPPKLLVRSYFKRVTLIECIQVWRCFLTVMIWWILKSIFHRMSTPSFQVNLFQTCSRVGRYQHPQVWGFHQNLDLVTYFYFTIAHGLSFSENLPCGHYSRAGLTSQSGCVSTIQTSNSIGYLFLGPFIFFTSADVATGLSTDVWRN